MRSVSLSPRGPVVPAIGLGCMAMSGVYGSADDAESIATIHAALEAGVTLLDTGDFYGMGHNELLLREALQGGKRTGAVISLKFGVLRTPAGGWAGVDARPAALRNFLAYSLIRLGTDYVDIYRPARLDPAVPIEETVGAIADLVQTGHVRHIGLSEVGAESIRRAHAVHPIADVQLEYSLMSRGIEAEILPTCRALGIAWLLSRGTDIVALIGMRSRARLAEALEAAGLALDAATLAEIGEAVPAEAVAGTRYDAAQMAHLDSEKPAR